MTARRLGWLLGPQRRVRAACQRLRAAAQGADGGSAIVEFIFLAVLLLVPLFYFVMVLGRLQAGAYAVSGAAREAGRAYVTSTSQDIAAARAQSAAGLAFDDQGFETQGHIAIRCQQQPCLARDGRVEITATVTVPLPLVPSFLSGTVPTTVPVTAAHVATVDRFSGQ